MTTGQDPVKEKTTKQNDRQARKIRAMELRQAITEAFENRREYIKQRGNIPLNITEDMTDMDSHVELLSSIKMIQNIAKQSIAILKRRPMTVLTAEHQLLEISTYCTQAFRLIEEELPYFRKRGTDLFYQRVKTVIENNVQESLKSPRFK